VAAAAGGGERGGGGAFLRLRGEKLCTRLS